MNTLNSLSNKSGAKQPLLLVLGSIVFRNSRVRFWSWALQDFGLRIRTRICRPHHSRPGIGLFSRHASRHGLCSIAPSTAYGSSVLGNCGPYRRLHGHGPDHVDHAWSFAIRVGLVTGIVTGAGATVNPYIEYYADNLPERRLGVFGIGLILCGFTMQSLQYWLALFDVRLT